MTVRLGTNGTVREVGPHLEVDEPISLDELTAFALAADPDAPLPPDATPFDNPEPGPSLLPAWYMPVPLSFGRSRRRALIALVIIGALLLINALGLCITYGRLEIA